MFWGCIWRYLEATAHWPAPSWPESLCQETWHWAHEESARKYAGEAPAIKRWSTNWKSLSTPANKEDWRRPKTLSLHYNKYFLNFLVYQLPTAQQDIASSINSFILDLIIAVLQEQEELQWPFKLCKALMYFVCKGSVNIN